MLDIDILESQKEKYNSELENVMLELKKCHEDRQEEMLSIIRRANYSIPNTRYSTKVYHQVNSFEFSLYSKEEKEEKVIKLYWKKNKRSIHRNFNLSKKENNVKDFTLAAEFISDSVKVFNKIKDSVIIKWINNYKELVEKKVEINEKIDKIEENIACLKHSKTINNINKILSNLHFKKAENQIEEALNKKEEQIEIAIYEINKDKIIFKNETIKINYGKRKSFYIGYRSVRKVDIVNELEKQFIFNNEVVKDIWNLPFSPENEIGSKTFNLGMNEIGKFVGTINSIVEF